MAVRRSHSYYTAEEQDRLFYALWNVGKRKSFVVSSVVPIRDELRLTLDKYLPFDEKDRPEILLGRRQYQVLGMGFCPDQDSPAVLLESDGLINKTVVWFQELLISYQTSVCAALDSRLQRMSRAEKEARGVVNYVGDKVRGAQRKVKDFLGI